MSVGLLLSMTVVFIGIIIFFTQRGQMKAKKAYEASKQNNLACFSTDLQEKYLHNKTEMEAKAEIAKLDKMQNEKEETEVEKEEPTEKQTP